MKNIIHHHSIKRMTYTLGLLLFSIGIGSWLGQMIPDEKPAQPSTHSAVQSQPATVSGAVRDSQGQGAPVSKLQSDAPVIPNYTIPVATDGMAPVIYRIPTDLPVVYLGIDDGANKTQAEVDLLAKNHIKASLFLSDLFIAAAPGFFNTIIAQGSIVENHTLSHNTRLINASYEVQKREVCGMADKIQQYYGRRPTLFRPPGGAYSDSLRRAAHDCGMKAVITWIAKANGGSMQYQVGNALRPGDVVLMHFRPEFEQDLNAFVAAMNAAGLHTELLETLPGAQ